MSQIEPNISRAALGPRRTVLLVDSEQRWVRQPADIVGAVIALLAIVVVAILAIYARSTTLAVANDVRLATGSVFETILFLPINALEGLLSFFLPLAIVAEMLLRRRWRTFVTAIAAGLVSILFANAMLWGFDKWWPLSPLTDQFIDAFHEQSYIALVPYVALLSALLTVSGSTKAARVSRWGWWLMAIVLVLSVLQGNQTFPGALITVFLGVFCGSLTRWAVGSEPDRATGNRLIMAVRRAGLDPVQVVRVDELPVDDRLNAWNITTSSPIGYIDTSALQQLRLLWSNTALDEDDPKKTEAAEIIAEVDALAEQDGIEHADGVDPDSIRDEISWRYPTAKANSVSRNYIATDTNGDTYHLLVLDDDRRILGAINDLWSKFRLKTTIRHVERTLEGTAEQITLQLLRVEQAKISEPRFVSIGRVDQSIIIALNALTAPLLSQVDGREVSDIQLDQLWDDLQRAHRCGISHGDLQADFVRVKPSGLEVTSWQNGSVVASDTARNIDLAQAIAMLATVVGVERAVASLTRSMPLDQIISLTPLLQISIMPGKTRAEFRGNKEFQALRDALIEQVPAVTSAAPVEIKRFSAKTIITVVIGVVAIYLLLGSMNFNDLRAALLDAHVSWMIAAFIIGLLTYLGAGITLKAYTPESLPLGQSTLVQIAASVVTLVAPAGIGPAALNLRFLQKKNIATTPALATVTVVQLAQFVTTIVLLILLSLGTGELGNLSLPSGSLLIGFGIAVAVIVLLFFIKPLRRWVIAKIRPTVEQIWPRLVWLTTHPKRILFGFSGSMLMTVAFIACFGFSLKAFGYELPLITLAVTYLVSNSVGSVVPSPGGIGPVEAALTGGLVIAGIPYSVAFSTAILYRLFTFWGRVPIGWVALRIAGKRNII